MIALIGYAVNLVVAAETLAPLAQLHSGIAILPGVLWFIFARLPEMRAEIPRVGLASTFWISALVANGVALPFSNGVLQLSQWLPDADPVTRIVGYTLGAGVVQEICKYLVVYSLTREARLQQRTDAVAYAVASAMGYATAINLVQALVSPATPGYASFDTFSTVALSVTPSLLVAYGIAETRLGKASAFLMPIMFALAALLYGTLTTLRGILTNAVLTLQADAQISQPNPIIDVALVAGIATVVAVSVAFLINNAERREAEAVGGR